MIKPFKTLFVYRVDTKLIGIYLDFRNKVCLYSDLVFITKDTKCLTEDEYLNLRELEKINLHIPYILSLLNERSNSL